MGKPVRTAWLIIAAGWLSAALLPAQPCEAAAAPTLWKHYYVRSASTGKIERFWVGHAARLKPDGRYPVIYFLPGLLGHESMWKTPLDAHLGKHEVIAVLPSVGGATWYMNSPRRPWMRWGDFLTRDLRAFVESHYPASRQKGQRGLAGISAGGHAALYHALRHKDLYGSISILSGALELRAYAGTVGLDYWIGPRMPRAMAEYQQRSSLVLISQYGVSLPSAVYLDVGDRDPALRQMEALKRILDTKGIACRWHLGRGTHNWTYWQTRAGDHLAWHAQEFARNRREGRYAQEPPAPEDPRLEVLKRPPDVGLSQEALQRLRAPWDKAPGRRVIPIRGLAAEGSPLAKQGPKPNQVKLTAPLDARGHESGLYVYRMTLRAGTPVRKAGTIAITGHVRNGSNLSMIAVPAAHLPVPAGEPNRRVEVRARLAVELKSPDPLRGGIVIALQPFDADGKPVGEPAVGKARPGSVQVERWTIAPQARTEWTLSLSGDDALPLAAVYEARLETEP